MRASATQPACADGCRRLAPNQRVLRRQAVPLTPSSSFRQPRNRQAGGELMHSFAQTINVPVVTASIASCGYTRLALAVLLRRRTCCTAVWGQQPVTSLCWV